MAMGAGGVWGCGSSNGADDPSGAGSSANPNGRAVVGAGGANAFATVNAPGGPVGTGATCTAASPVVTVPNASGTPVKTCTGAIAETRFQSALCTCHDASVAGYLRVRGFDSAQGPFQDGVNDGGAAVGINNAYFITTGYTDVAGSFAVAGPHSLSFAGYLKVWGDLRAAGSVAVAGYTNIGRDAWLGAGLTDLGPVTVGRDVHAAGTLMAIPLVIGGQRTQENVQVRPPCPCAPSDLLDVGALVDDARLNNDNAALGINPSMFNLLVGNVQATLPCGRIYIERMGGLGNLIVDVTGKVALFVDGSIDAAGNVEFRLAPGAEIDIFIRENLVLAGRAVFGDPTHPASTRIYVGGSGDVVLVGAGTFVGNVYAPRSLVTAVGFADVWGSVFARDFVSPGYARMVYDRAITRAGSDCSVPPPPGTCSQCGTCTGGLACVQGSCGPCTTDAECCGQLACIDGRCMAVTIY
jgi:hypothetical protein